MTILLKLKMWYSDFDKMNFALRCVIYDKGVTI